MRAGILLVPLFLLAACKEEPRFDERYDKAAKEIEARALAMDADIAKSDEAATTSKDLPKNTRPSNAPTSSGE